MAVVGQVISQAWVVLGDKDAYFGADYNCHRISEQCAVLTNISICWIPVPHQEPCLLY
jgi:hypothetical protein